MRWIMARLFLLALFLVLSDTLLAEATPVKLKIGVEGFLIGLMDQ
jgi:hypothetical protein